jgi:hypothetical protein
MCSPFEYTCRPLLRCHVKQSSRMFDGRVCSQIWVHSSWKTVRLHDQACLDACRGRPNLCNPRNSLPEWHTAKHIYCSRYDSPIRVLTKEDTSCNGESNFSPRCTGFLYSVFVFIKYVTFVIFSILYMASQSHMILNRLKRKQILWSAFKCFIV